MLRRELKVNFKSFLIWMCVLIALFLMVFLMYPSIMNSDNVKMLNEMLKIFPEEVLKTFNMDISQIDSAFGWLKTEGFVFVLLITGVYSGIMGSNILLKEENDKTIEYLNSNPITRKRIVLSKVLAGLFYITLMILMLGIFNFMGLSLIEKFDKKLFILLSLTPLFSSFVIFSFCLFISNFFHKTKKVLGISLGFVFISYFLLIISELSSVTEFFKYISVFTLADIRNVITNIQINPLMVIISIFLTIIFILLSLFSYDRKELV